MQVIEIKGKSGFFKGGTNTGVYFLENGEALIIDAGHTTARGSRIVKYLSKQGVRPKYVYTTHEHFDHFEAFTGIREEIADAELIAHYQAKPYIENLYIGTAYLSSSSIPSFFGRRNGGGLGRDMMKDCGYRVDLAVNTELIIGSERFEIVYLPGHAAGQAVLITPDKVCYLGDLVMDHHIIDTYDMPFLFSIELQTDSLMRLEELDFEYGLIAHGKNFYTKDEIVALADRNLAVMERYEQDILQLLEQPMSRENILASLLCKNQIECTYASYHYNNSTVGAFLAKLANQGRITYNYKEGKIFYSVISGG